MATRLFSTTYAVEHENRTGSNTYSCRLDIFDDRTCVRVTSHHRYDCEPPFGSDSTKTQTYRGRWTVSADADRLTLRIEEQEDWVEHRRIDGSPGHRDDTTERRRDAVPLVEVEVLPLLEGQIVGANTGAPTAPAPDDASSTETRQTEGDMNAFLVFLWNARS